MPAEKLRINPGGPPAVSPHQIRVRKISSNTSVASHNSRVESNWNKSNHNGYNAAAAERNFRTPMVATEKASLVVDDLLIDDNDVSISQFSMKPTAQISNHLSEKNNS